MPYLQKVLLVPLWDLILKKNETPLLRIEKRASEALRDTEQDMTYIDKA